MKTFTIVSADKQNRVSFETEATTVGELLQELDARNINYNGMTLHEGLTRSSFSPENTSGILPHDVNYTNKKTGEQIQTSNLVFMLTTTDKKTSSGMTRSELYITIKSGNLADAIKEVFGRNFTQVKTEDLEKFVAEQNNKETMPKSKQESNDNEEVCDGCPASDLICAFVHAAIKKGIIDPEDLLVILAELGVVERVDDDDKSAHKFSDDEIDAMFD